MSTTVVHPRTTRFPGRRVGMIILGVALAAAAGYGISTTDDEPAPANVASSQAAGADQLILNRAAEFAAERQNLLNQATKGIGPDVATAPQVSVESLSNWLAQSATSHVSATEFADQLTRDAAGKIGTDAWDSYLNGIAVSGAEETARSQIGTDAWDSYLNGTGVSGAEETPTFEGQTGPR